MTQQKNETQKIEKQKPATQIEKTPTDSQKASRKNEIEKDLLNEGWQDNPGRKPDVELPNELYNEILPPDTRLV